jgi:putative transposase
MIKSFKIRLEPNNIQNTLLFQYAGVARWAYNYTLSKQQQNYKNGGKFISDGDIRKEITQLKKTDAYEWLNDVSANVPKQAVKDCCEAFKKFFKGKAKYPKFKSKKKSRPSFFNDTYKIHFTKTHVQLEKIEKIKLSEYNRIPFGKEVKYSNPRITHDGLHWYISIGVEVENHLEELTPESIGIDLGIKDLAICSNGNIYKNINKIKRVKRLEKRLRKLQRQVSRKYQMNKDGITFIKTKNVLKLETKIKKLHKVLANIRTDYRHKLTSEIVKTKPSRIVIEDLNVKGMMKNKHLSKAVAQQGFYELATMLEYKSNKKGIEFVKANRWYPSSKTCSECGYVKPRLSLSEREFKCECCGCVIDRDLNASINLARYKIS